MSDLVSFSLVTFSAIFFVVDPLALVPLYLALTHGDTLEGKRATARKAAVVSGAILVVFAFAGTVIFQLFGITIGAFKIAGGLLLFLVSLDMMRAQPSRTRTSPEEQKEGIEKDDVAVIPLAIPMLSGPGAIATVTVLMSEARTAGGRESVVRVAVVVTCVVLTSIFSYAILRAAVPLARLLRQTGLNILNRLMGLILAAVAVQFVINGVYDTMAHASRH